ncbi:hypothetical protein H0H87_010618 [Tephrocybe sp. NHM501043]|nr:hypothetical protein H0H87_010618 [Tephrocybe sp. NHM501043]
MFANLINLSLLLVVALAAFANPHGSPHHNRHVEIAKRQGGNVQLYKRYSSARWTFYDVGLGACGVTNVASDFIVALNSNQYGGGYPGPNCFKKISMTYNGKTTTATITDECPGCPYGGLDLSRGLFKFFAPESEGVLTGTWNFIGDGGDDDTPTTSTYVVPKTTSTKHTTSTWTPDPTTFWTPEPTTSTSKKTTSTSHTSSSTSSSYISSSKASSSANHSTSTSASSATTSATPSSTQSALNLATLDQSFLHLGVLVVAAA